MSRIASGGRYGAKDLDRILRQTSARSAVKTGAKVAGVIGGAKLAQRAMANNRIRNKRHQEKMQRRK